jgi:hypothetical protein
VRHENARVTGGTPLAPEGVGAEAGYRRLEVALSPTLRRGSNELIDEGAAISVAMVLLACRLLLATGERPA